MRDIAARHHTATTVPRGLLIVGAASASWLLVGATGLALSQVLALLATRIWRSATSNVVNGSLKLAP